VTRTVNVIGDSHTAVLGPRLKQLLDGDDVWFVSYPGFSTARVLTALETQEEFDGTVLRPADLTIVILGGNDFGDRNSERSNLLEFLGARRAGKILWAGPAHSKDAGVDARHRAQADSQQDQLELLRIDWIDSYPVTQTGHGPDGVHFRPSGYDAWAGWIAEAARKRTRSALWPTLAWAAVLGVVGGIFYKTLRLGKKR
jgi:lysophospholipase L1-like esterase